MIPAAPPRRPQRRAGRRKLAALDAAVTVIAQRGADATRFVDVAESSGVPVSTLQYYFGSREDLLVAAFRHASATELAELRERLETIGDPWDQLTHIVEVALAGYRPPDARSGRLWIESWRFAMRDVEMRADVLEDYSSWRALLRDAVRRGETTGRFHPVAPAGEIAMIVLALIDGIGLPLALGDPPVTVPSAARSVGLSLEALLLPS